MPRIGPNYFVFLVVARSTYACMCHEPQFLAWLNCLRICVDRVLVVYVYITDDSGEEGPMLTYYIPMHV
jgi:hypothetical protein